MGRAAPAFDRGRGVKRHVEVNVFLVQWRGVLVVHARDPTQLSTFQANAQGTQARTFLPWFYGRSSGVLLKEMAHLALKSNEPEATFTISARISSPLAGYGRCEYNHRVFIIRVPDDKELVQASSAQIADELLPDVEFAPTMFTGKEEERLSMGRLYLVSPDVFAAHLNSTRRASLGHAVLDAFVGGERALVRAVRVSTVAGPDFAEMLERLQFDDVGAIATSLSKNVDVCCLRRHTECYDLLHHQGEVGLALDSSRGETVEHLFTQACRVIGMYPGAGRSSLLATVAATSHETAQLSREQRHAAALYYTLPCATMLDMRRFNEIASGHHILTPRDGYLVMTLLHDLYLQVYRGSKTVESRLNWDGPNRAVRRGHYLVICSTESGWPPLWRTVAGVYHHTDYPDAVATHGETLWQGASGMDREQVELTVYRLLKTRFTNIQKFRDFFAKSCWGPALPPVLCWSMTPVVGIVEYASGTPLGVALRPGARGVFHADLAATSDYFERGEGPAGATSIQTISATEAQPIDAYAFQHRTSEKLNQILSRVDRWAADSATSCQEDAPCGDSKAEGPGIVLAPEDWRNHRKATNIILFYTEDGSFGEFSNFFSHKPWLFEVPSWCNNLDVHSAFLVRTAEEAIMACKAALMGDIDSFRAIAGQLLAPIDAKRIGRSVNGYEQVKWDTHKAQIGLYAIACKATQNPSFALRLFETNECIIAEAAPRDLIWGIGLRATDPDALHPSKWPGTNLLGHLLMQYRLLLQADSPWPGPARV